MKDASMNVLQDMQRAFEIEQPMSVYMSQFDLLGSRLKQAQKEFAERSNEEVSLAACCSFLLIASFSSWICIVGVTPELQCQNLATKSRKMLYFWRTCKC